MDRSARPVLEEELPELLRFLNEVFRPHLSAPLDVSYPFFFGSPRARLNNFRVISVNGKIVSHVGICEQKAIIGDAELNVAWIGAVATDPDYRSRGFANLLMQDALRLLRERECDLALLNGPRRLYERSGFDLGGAELRFTLSDRCVDGLFDTPADIWRSTGAVEDAACITAAHRESYVRIHRTQSDTQTLLRIPHRSTYCASNGPDFAYVITDEPMMTPNSDARRLSVAEFGGSIQLVVRLLEYLFASGALATISLRDAAAHHERCKLFLRIADGYSIAPFANLRIVSLRRLLQRMAPAFSRAQEQAVRPRTGTIAIEWYDDHACRETVCLELEAGAVHVGASQPKRTLRLDSIKLVQLLYGLRMSRRIMWLPPDAANLIKDIFPLDVYASQTDRQ